MNRHDHFTISLGGVPVFSAGTNPVALIAVGVFPVGIIAIGIISAGLIAVGQVSAGGFTLGQVSLALMTLAQVGAGLVFFGQAGFGILASFGQAAGGMVSNGLGYYRYHIDFQVSIRENILRIYDLIRRKPKFAIIWCGIWFSVVATLILNLQPQLQKLVGILAERIGR
jgi:hypothetical protein